MQERLSPRQKIGRVFISFVFVLGAAGCGGGGKENSTNPTCDPKGDQQDCHDDDLLVHCAENPDASECTGAIVPITVLLHLLSGGCEDGTRPESGQTCDSKNK